MAAAITRLKEWVEKGLMNFHVVDEIPRGYRFSHPAFDSLPGLDKFVNNARKRKVVDMHRNFTLIGAPFILPPGTPKEQIDILSEAMRKTFRDAEFTANFKKLTSADATPLFPEEQAKAIKQIPRDLRNSGRVQKNFRRRASTARLVIRGLICGSDSFW